MDHGISAALATHQAGTSQLPFVFPWEWKYFPSAIYWNIWCFHSSSPSLGSACLGNLNLLTINPRGTAEVGIIYILMGQHCCSAGILGCFQHHLSPSKCWDSAGSEHELRAQPGTRSLPDPSSALFWAA